MYDMDAADAATEVFEGYLTDSENEKLVAWWRGEWSNCIHMWCKAYRQTYFTRDMNTNNPNESTNRAVKYYIQDRWDFKMRSMVSELVNHVTREFDTKHARAQALDQARKFTKSLEAFEGATEVDARKLFSSKATLALTQMGWDNGGFTVGIGDSLTGAGILPGGVTRENRIPPLQHGSPQAGF